MPLKSEEPQPEPSEESDFDAELREFMEKGWEIMSDGPSGVQLQAPKTMKGLDKACMVVGFLTVIFWGIGLIFILIAFLDYWFFTERDTAFLPRPKK